MKRFGLAGLLACTSIGAIICAAGPAFAQSVTDTPPSSQASSSQPVEDALAETPTGTVGDAAQGDIIVTAQKRSERLSEVPMSITAATAGQLQSRGITDTEQLGKLVPGFSFQKSNYGLPIYFIRGVGFFDTTLGVSPAVTVYVDQVPLPFSPMSRGAVLDLERIEVLKGPQGTLFGQNSTGGAINYIAAKPTDTLQAGFVVQGGRFDDVQTEAFVSGPITDTLSARVALRHEYQGPWQKNYVNDDRIGRKNFTNGRLILDWNPLSTVRLEFQGSAWQDRSETQQPQFISYEPLTPVAAGGRPQIFPVETFPAAPRDPRAAAWTPGIDYRRRDDFYQASLRADVDLSDTVTVTSLSAYAKFKANDPQDLDATIYPIDGTRVIGSIKSFSQELRVSGSLINNRIKWMIGGNYQNDKVRERFVLNPGIDTGGHIGPVNFDNYFVQNNQDIETKSGFGSLDFDLTSKLTGQGSVRYTKQDRSFAGCVRDSGDGQAANAFSLLSTLLSGSPQTIAPGRCITLSATTGLALPIVNGSLNQDNVAYRGSLNWKPLAGTIIYANVTKGFKAGSFPTLPAAVDNQLFPVPQESVLAYEAGIKLDVLDRKLQFEAAGFYYDYRKKQLVGYRVVQPFGALPSLVSIPKSRIVGGEINLTFRPFEGFRISGGGTYIRTKVQEDPANPTGPFGSTGSFVGQSFPFTPKWQGVADAEYRFPVSDGVDVFLGGSVAARTGTQGALFNGVGADALKERQLLIPGYTLVDVRAGIDLTEQGVRVELYGRNITNRFYLTNATRVSDFVERFTGMPATYGITLRYNFGR